MEPVTLAIAAVTFAGSCIAQKCADATIDAVWARLKSRFRSATHDEPNAREVVEQTTAATLADPALFDEVEAVFQHSPALRRAKLVHAVLDGARILWVDDHPENNTWERALLGAFSVSVTCVSDTASALKSLQAQDCDVIISDMGRSGVRDEGARALSALKAVRPATPVIFYTFGSNASVAPANAFGITTRPDDLLHLILDCLERRRI